MANCPVCNRKNIFGEQVNHSDRILGFTYFDCPACGAFRMNPEAQVISGALTVAESDLLLSWIREKNEGGIIPMINSGLVSAFHVAGNNQSRPDVCFSYGC